MGALKPREGVLNINYLSDCGYRSLFDPAVLEAGRGYWLVQKVSQGCHYTLCPREALFQAAKMRGNQIITNVYVRGGENCADVRQRHVQIAESADDLSRWNLGCRIGPIASLRVHVRRFQKTALVVAAERLDAEVGRLSEISNSK